MTIGVLGATGTVGSLVTHHLSDKGLATRALVHREEAAGALDLPGVEVQVGDYRNDEDLQRFLAGIDQLLLLTAPDDDQVEVQNHIIDLVAQTGAIGITKLSAWTAAADAPLTLSRDHHAIETHLAASGVPYTNLQAHTFMQTTALLFADEVRLANTMTSSVGPDAGILMVDARDVADVAAAVLARGDHHGETLVIHGPEGLSYADCAKLISTQLGRDIQHNLISHEEAKARFLQLGLPEFLADVFVTLFEMYDSGKYEPESNTVTQSWTGHASRSYNDFLTGDPTPFT